MTLSRTIGPRTVAPKRTFRALLSMECLEARTMPTVDVLSVFNGINFSQSSCACQPPDPMAAAGPDHIVQVVNTAVAVYDKSTGGQLFLQPLKAFFAPAGAAKNVFDPLVTYDEMAGRFVVSILEADPVNRQTWFNIAVSNTSNPLDGFRDMHRIETTEMTPEGIKLGSDYPSADRRPRRSGHPCRALALKKASFAGHTPAKRPSLTVTPSFVPRLHIIGTFSAASGKVCALIVARSGSGFSSGTPERSQAAATRSGMQQHHAAGPVTAAAVSPQRPRHLGQLRMAGLRAEIDEALLKRGVGAVARIAPHLAVGLLRLLVGRSQQGAVVLLRQRLPVQVVGAGQPRLARSLAATVLMHDHAAQRLHALWDPDRVVDRIDQLARLRRSLVAHAVVRRVGRRKDIIRRLLRGRSRRRQESGRQNEHGAYGEIQRQTKVSHSQKPRRWRTTSSCSGP